MKIGKFASALMLGAASTLMAAMPASAQYFGSNYDQRASGDLILYEHDNYRGRALPIDQSVAGLDRLGFNDRVSSIEVRRGRWEVCVDGNFRGSCRIIDASIPNTSYIRLNDNISSVRRVDGYAGGNGYGRDRDYDRHRGWDRGRGYGHNRHDNDRWDRGHRRDQGGYYGSGQGALVLYEHSNYNGWSVPVSSDIYDLDQLRINNEVSSMRVTSGRWLVCSEVGYRGQCEVITGSVNSAHAIRMNDRISSVRRIG
tara:strand:+ start:588 stop:1352 length:765 start_codon:yes stop_codon:yes gene_type:complete